MPLHRLNPFYILLTIALLTCLTLSAAAAEKSNEIGATTETINYQIDADTAYIHIYTDNRGLFKSLSHRHLIAIRNISGIVYWNGVNSHAALTLNPADFFVDPNRERKNSPDPDYQHKAANWVKSGTKKNMLSRRFLNTEMYPNINANISLASLENENAVFIIELKIVGQQKRLSLPAKLTLSDDKLHVYGDFSIDHSELGLKPFTAAAGAAKVAQPIRLIVDISASKIIQ